MDQLGHLVEICQMARKGLTGFGTQTAGLAATGFDQDIPGNTTSTEEYNGTSWTAGGNVGTARRYLAGCGIQTAGLIFGSSTPPRGATEEYDGSTWTVGGSLNTARSYLAGCGTQTAGLAFGGDTPSITGATELNMMELLGQVLLQV
jgi:hypothetical protein